MDDELDRDDLLGHRLVHVEYKLDHEDCEEEVIPKDRVQVEFYFPNHDCLE